MKPGMPKEFRLLLLRYCELGNLLPHDDLATAFQDAGARGEAKIVLREMSTVKQQIDNFLAAARDVGASRAARPRIRPRDAA